jgi:2-polyprenyl-3-methyl-5-hydroxy-6-metoxy-1,4-benzoquinol methylase
MDRFLLGIDRSKDNAAYYAIPGIRAFFLRRLKIARALLPNDAYGRLIDVGYGAGLLLRELGETSYRLHGVDIHDFGQTVRQNLSLVGIDVCLVRGGVLSLPFQNGSFDGVLCLSLLEHVVEIDTAVDELARILRPGGIAVIGFPPRTAVTSLLFRLIGFDHEKLHPTDHHAILSALSSRFVVGQMLRFPRAIPLYVLCRCVKKRW